MSGRSVGDPEALRRDRAEHGHRIGAGGVVEEHAARHRPLQHAEQAGARGLDLDAAGLALADEPAAPHGAVDRLDRRHVLDGPDARDHLLRLRRQRAGGAAEALPGLHLEQVRAQLVELVEQAGLARPGDAEHRHDRRDADRDADRRQRRPGASRAESERADAQQVGEQQAAGGDLAHAAVSDSIAPSRITTWRLVAAATSWSCVITTIVVPSAFSSAQQRQHVLAGARVEVAGRLVGEHDRRASHQGARDRHPLALAARQLGRRVREPVAEPDALQRGRGGAPSLARAGCRRTAARRRRCRPRSARRAGRTAGTRTRSGATAVPTGCRSDRRTTSTPSSSTSPTVGRSSVPITCSSVDLPEPDGPTIATSSPSLMSRSTSRSTVIDPS